MRKKNKRISFALRSQLSELQELCGGKMKHKAFCKTKADGKFFDLIRVFEASKEITLKIYIKEDKIETNKSIFFTLEKDLSNNIEHLSDKNFDYRKVLVTETKFLDYEELKNLLNTWISFSKGDFLEGLNKRLPC